MTRRPISARDRSLFASRPGPILRIIFRAPMWLYRMNLGWLLGHRFLLLTHRGRISGRVYRTVLEVAQYNPRTKETVVGSGWGTRADWCRNIQAGGALEIETGRECYQPEFRVLAPEEVYEVMVGYTRRLPPIIRPLVYHLGLDVRGSEAQRRAHSAQLLMVGFRPASVAPPTSQTATMQPSA